MHRTKLPETKLTKLKLEQIAKETLSIINEGCYKIDINTKQPIKHEIEEMKRTTRTFTRNERDFNPKINPKESLPFVTVEDGTTNKAIDFYLRNCTVPPKNVTVLNFASAKNPGGGWLNGMNTQEEALTRTSLLYASLTSKMEYYEYNKKNLNKGLYSNKGIYSYNVPYIREYDTEELTNPVYVDVITIPAVNKRATSRTKVDSKIVNREMVYRVQTLLEEYLKEVLDRDIRDSVLILGAFGCGVFRNDPAFVAEIFKYLLTAYKYVFVDRNIRVDFAIPKGPNLDIFKEILLSNNNESNNTIDNNKVSEPYEIPQVSIKELKTRTNKQKISSFLKSSNLSLGIYDDRIDKLSKSNVETIIQNVENAPTDLDIAIDNKVFVLEISEVDSEIDMQLISKEDYISRYGSERWDEE